MTKPDIYESRQQTQSSVLMTLSGPSIPVGHKFPEVEKRFFDPSSGLPSGLSYPIPSFFEYKAGVEELEY